MNVSLLGLRFEPFAEVFNEAGVFVVYAGWVTVRSDGDGLLSGDTLNSARFKVMESKRGVRAFKKHEFSELFSICEAYISNSESEAVSNLIQALRHRLARAVVFEITKAVIHEQLKQGNVEGLA